MLIRSQDKKRIYVLESAIGIFINDDNYIYIGTSFLGRYSSEEKAIKVLDMIQKEYTKAYFGPGGKDALTGEMFQPFGFVPPKVFQMPADEEVEG